MTVDAEGRWRGKGIVKGRASGPARLSATAISFLGDVEITTGRVVGRSSDLFGACMAGTVLLVPSTRGSAGAWRFIHQLRKHDTHPVAIAMREMPDPSVVQGAILSGIPIVVGLPEDLWFAVRTGQRLTVDGTDGTVSCARGRWSPSHQDDDEASP
jgi:uncharacterized protein